MPDSRMGDEDEEPLRGGNQTGGVVRVGDTVRRPGQACSPAIRTLLDHLATSARGIAPRSLGTDEIGRDITTFAAGEPGHYPLSASIRSDASLVAAARLLRRYHDATVTLTERPDLHWSFVDPDPGTREVICHNDFAPYNIIFRYGLPAVLLDFDHAGPGSRLRDVAYAVYRFAPLASGETCRDAGWTSTPDRMLRACMFVEAYGLGSTDGLVAMVERRIRDLRDGILGLAATAPERVAIQLAEDHVGTYNSDLAWVDANREELESTIRKSLS